jgi:predicted lipid-binding transport protein (Tim44 family)
VEIVFLAVVACLVLARLYQVLGQDNGARPPAQPDKLIAPDLHNNIIRPVIDEKTDEKPVENIKTEQEILSEKYGSLSEKIEAVRKIDKNFDPNAFEIGAARAYEAIVTAYGAGDLDALKTLLTPNVFEAYKSAVEARETGSAKIDIVRVSEPTIREIEIGANLIRIDVAFSATLVEGQKKPRNTDEIWSFEKAPNMQIWHLCAVETA